MGVVLDKTKATRGFVEPVETHDQALDLTTFGEELIDLLLGGVE